MKLYNLRNFQNDNKVRCPKCNKELELVSSGFDDLLFCKDCQKVYNVSIRDVTKKASPEYIAQCNNYVRVNAVIDDRVKLYQNIDEIEAILNKQL